MQPVIVAGGVLHLLSRALLLHKFLWERNCRGISLVTQELYLLIYVFRYLDLLFLYVSLLTTGIKVLHLCLALACVGLMRYSPALAQTYDADIDTFPRVPLVVVALVFALLFHKVALFVELMWSFSTYLEAVSLLPQFALLYKRQKYEVWVLVYVTMLGGYRLVHNSSWIWKLDQAAKEPYALAAAAVHAFVFTAGMVVLLYQQVKLRRTQGLNEADKPSFDEVWEASKFNFESDKAALAKTIP